MNDSNKADHSVEVNEMVLYLRREFKYLQEAKEFYEDQVNYKAANLLARTEAKRVEAIELLDRFVNAWRIKTNWGDTTMANDGELNAIKQAVLDAREGGE